MRSFFFATLVAVTACGSADRPPRTGQAAAIDSASDRSGASFYSGRMFPEKYRHGAFIAFHGSWNRAPEAQAGYNVAFQPFADGSPQGDYEIFADGFAGGNKQPGTAAHRPAVLALGPDGSLYVSDDNAGRL